ARSKVGDSEMTDTQRTRVIYYHGGQVRDLTGSVRSLEMSGDTAQAYRTCAVELNNTRDGRHYAIPFKNGGELRVLYFGREVFRGILFTKAINTDGGQSLSAHDY